MWYGARRSLVISCEVVLWTGLGPSVCAVLSNWVGSFSARWYSNVDRSFRVVSAVLWTGFSPNSKHWFYDILPWRKVSESDARSVGLVLPCVPFKDVWGLSRTFRGTVKGRVQEHYIRGTQNCMFRNGSWGHPINIICLIIGYISRTKRFFTLLVLRVFWLYKTAAWTVAKNVALHVPEYHRLIQILLYSRVCNMHTV